VVRNQARALGLVTADKPESQEICFIPDDDYRGFLRRRMPNAFGPGPIVDGQGTVLGRHAGLVNYTVGQRRGLGLAAGRPLYVTALDPSRNAVVVGGEDEVEVQVILAEQVNFISIPDLEGPVGVEAKIRHTHEAAAAWIEPAEDGLIRVRFERAQRAPAPGQSVVFYQGDLVVGGGVIARSEVS